MKPAETKAYIATLKKLAKSNKSLEFLQGVGIRDGIAEATDLTTMVKINLGIKGQAVYNTMALDIFAQTPDADLEPYKVADLEDWPELPDYVWTDPVDITPELDAAILEGRDYASSDQTRPALTAVWLRQGEVQATDGYKMYLSGPIKNLDKNDVLNLRAEVIDLYKKMRKYGTWTYQFAENGTMRLTNGVAEIIANCIDATFPDVRALAEKSSQFYQRIHLPIAQLRTIIDRKVTGIYVNRDGSIKLDQTPVPFTATIEEQPITLFPASPRRVVMPLVNHDNNVALAVNPVLLRQYKPDKSGYIELAITLTDRPVATPVEVIVP